MAGSVQLGMSPIQGAVAYIATGKVRALAVTGSRRQPTLPDVPSLSEADFKGLEGFDPYSFYGLVGPARMSPTIISTLNEPINRISRTPEVISYMQEKLYAEPGTGSPAAFRTYIENDLAKWKTLAKVVKLSD